MKNVLFLAMSLGSGGAERQMVTIAIQLKQLGHNIKFICYSHGDFYEGSLIDAGVPVIWKVESNYLKRILGIRNHIRRNKYDVVISFLQTPNFLNNISGVGGRSWKIVTGERSSKTSTFKSIRGRIFAWFQRYSDVIVCNSNNANELWQQNFPNLKHKLKTIYNTVTTPQVLSQYQPRLNGKTNIIIAASFQKLKNPTGLIEAISLLDERDKSKLNIEWYGRTEGSNGFSEEYIKSEEMIHTHKLSNTITLHPATKQIFEHMNKADIVALFSQIEGLPNAICEGMMLSKPIIMTEVSDYELLVDDTNGYLCKWDQPESIKQALLWAINLTPDEILMKGRESKRKAMTLFDSKSTIDNWCEMLKN